MNKKKKGFTLTEILVVVLIISILAAVVYPLYTKSITKSRAVEAINLLEMVRSKQLQEFAREGEYFSNFADIGSLTSDKSNESVSGATLKVKDYTLSLNNATKCMSANYKKGSTNFTFSTSYENAGLGCTGAICTSFGDIIGDAKSVCNCGSKVCTGGFTRNEETCECECNKECNNGSTCQDKSGGGMTRACPSGCGTQTSTASCGGPVWSGSCTSEYLSLPTSQSCANGGTQYRTCSASCSGGACGAWGPCTGGKVDCTGTKPDTSTSCGSCGTKNRSVTCNDSTGVWETGSWGTCVEGSCGGTIDCNTSSKPAASEACGTCGTRTRTVTCDTSKGTWQTGSWSGCAEGNCGGGNPDPKDCPTASKPAASEACGNCGTRSRSVTCDTSSGTWTTSTWGTCGSQGVCAPGATQKCGTSNTGTQTCSSSCTWGTCYGEAKDCDPYTRPDSRQDCMACGIQTRTVSCKPDGSGWQTGPWTKCTGHYVMMISCCDGHDFRVTCKAGGSWNHMPACAYDRNNPGCEDYFGVMDPSE